MDMQEPTDASYQVASLTDNESSVHSSCYNLIFIQDHGSSWAIQFASKHLNEYVHDDF